MTTAPRVLVAHESEAILAVITSLLGTAGYTVDAVLDGVSCRAALPRTPACLVLDVALSDVFAFELIAEARRALPTLRIILVASIYNRTSYKRRPTSLYGADDYVEQHHIADSLVGKVEALVRGAAPPSPTTHEPETLEGAKVRVAGLGRVERGATHENAPDGLVRAQRLARLIVADIALYNGDAVAAARKGSGREGLEAQLRADLEEGRLLLDLRIPIAVRAGRDFIGDALAELIAGPGGRGTR